MFLGPLQLQARLGIPTRKEARQNQSRKTAYETSGDSSLPVFEGLIGYSSCEKSTKASKLNQQVGSVDYKGYSKD